MTQPLLDDIAFFCHMHDMAPSTFGQLAVGNRAFVGRLKGTYGRRLDPRQSTVDRIYAFMDRYEEQSRQAMIAG